LARFLRRRRDAGPLVIGIDEISVKEGQEYRIVVSDLLRRRAWNAFPGVRSDPCVDRATRGTKETTTTTFTIDPDNHITAHATAEAAAATTRTKHEDDRANATEKHWGSGARAGRSAVSRVIWIDE
jgi:hypothetical protein